ncbi:DMT family transporter [Ideonella livida]|nr:DMT family transporter [Ideonella livida]
MIVVTLMWSIAGVVSRHLDAARTFEVTFWRSAVNAVALAGLLVAWRGAGPLWRQIRDGGWLLWASSACWCVMFTAFMVALTLTTVANLLIIMSLAPLFTALIARLALGHRLPWRTWGAIAVAAGGIAWMYGPQMAGGDERHLWGSLIGLTVPLAGATMWTLLQHSSQAGAAAPRDMTPAVLLGSLGSAVLTLPGAWPFQATVHDLALLGLLGVVQLAVPCVLAVAAGKVLKAPEAALLGLLEIVFGVAWTWLGTDESPTPAVLGGGGLVLLALAGNEALALWGGRGGREPSAEGGTLPA